MAARCTVQLWAVPWRGLLTNRVGNVDGVTVIVGGIVLLDEVMWQAAVEKPVDVPVRARAVSISCMWVSLIR